MKRLLLTVYLKVFGTSKFDPEGRDAKVSWKQAWDFAGALTK